MYVYNYVYIYTRRCLKVETSTEGQGYSEIIVVIRGMTICSSISFSERQVILLTKNQTLIFLLVASQKKSLADRFFFTCILKINQLKVIISTATHIQFSVGPGAEGKSKRVGVFFLNSL